MERASARRSMDDEWTAVELQELDHTVSERGLLLPARDDLLTAAVDRRACPRACTW